MSASVGVDRRPTATGSHVTEAEDPDIPETVVDEGRLRSIVEEAAEQPAYAIDTEFHRERTYYPKVALLQMNWGSGIALIDPLAVSLEPLGAVLEGPGLAVMHACTPRRQTSSNSRGDSGSEPTGPSEVPVSRYRRVDRCRSAAVRPGLFTFRRLVISRRRPLTRSNRGVRARWFAEF